MNTTNYIYYLNDECNALLAGLLADETFDIKIFNEWLDTKDIKGKNNPSAYFKKAFLEELERGAFKKQPKPTINCQVLYNAMRENGIEVIEQDTFYINTLLDYIYQNDILSEFEIKECMKKGIGYLKNQDKNSTDFIDLLKRSKALRGKSIDYEKIQKEFEQIKNGYKLIMQSIGQKELYKIREVKTGKIYQVYQDYNDLKLVNVANAKERLYTPYKERVAELIENGEYEKLSDELTKEKEI